MSAANLWLAGCLGMRDVLQHMPDCDRALPARHVGGDRVEPVAWAAWAATGGSTRRIVARRQRRLRGHVTTDRIPFWPRAKDVAHPEAYALDGPRLGVAGGVW